jgi:hypothetical protein
MDERPRPRMLKTVAVDPSGPRPASSTDLDPFAGIEPPKPTGERA